jgi:hypothetical protein
MMGKGCQDRCIRFRVAKLWFRVKNTRFMVKVHNYCEGFRV